MGLLTLIRLCLAVSSRTEPGFAHIEWADDGARFAAAPRHSTTFVDLRDLSLGTSRFRSSLSPTLTRRPHAPGAILPLSTRIPNSNKQPETPGSNHASQVQGEISMHNFPPHPTIPKTSIPIAISALIISLAVCAVTQTYAQTGAKKRIANDVKQVLSKMPWTSTCCSEFQDPGSAPGTAPATRGITASMVSS